MTILSEIQKWAENLPVWQQHAVAVLYERPTPSVEDLEDILALLQDFHGIPDPVGRKARKLTREESKSLRPKPASPSFSSPQSGTSSTSTRWRQERGFPLLPPG